MSDQDYFDGPAITRPRAPAEPTPPVLKRDITPMKLSAILIAVALVALAWMFRWEVTPTAAGSTNYSTAYLLDRWTGTLYHVASNGKYKVKLEDD